EGPGAGGGPKPARRRVRHREPLRGGRHRRRDAARRPGAPAAERTGVDAMRWVRVGLLAGLAAKAVIVGAWWWTSVARAERPVAEAPVAPDLFAKSRGFRELLEAVRQRGEELDRREQALATREASVKAMGQALAEEAGRGEGGGGGAPAGETPGWRGGGPQPIQRLRP